ncbi:hypothetical protein D3C76_1033570 [compost metagenome]
MLYVTPSPHESLTQIRLRVQIDCKRSKILPISSMSQLRCKSSLTDSALHVNQAYGNCRHVNLDHI